MTIKPGEIRKTVSSYDQKRLTIGVIGSQSAEEVGIAARAFGLPVAVICQKGREKLYTKYNKHLFDHQIIVDKFSDMANMEVQERLIELNTIFMPNRSFSVYLGYDKIENDFRLPIYGSRHILRSEERTSSKNQYMLLEKAGIKIPKLFSKPEEIDRMAIVKVQQKARPLERAFFHAKSSEEYYEKSARLIKEGIIDREGLGKARIEEFVLGQRFNANFQSWALADAFDNFDFVGFDDRKQTNLNGLLSLPAKEQISLDMIATNEEVGHYGLTMRESLKPLVYDAAEKFVAMCKNEYKPGIFGLFALQGALAINPDDSKHRLAFYVFDLSPRIPGAPAVGPTSPEMRRLSLKYANMLRKHKADKVETMLDLPMLDILEAVSQDRLHEVVT
jgi:5-formaminoimidazole-4-carboxamide-1-(beta)-D-ribofuranosyl 5'-monophosphate synthetase